ncbi:MAG: TOMM precursor leader peptide-binding protein [Acidimicrobiales bacterium]
MPDRPYLKPWYRHTEAGGRLVLEYGQSTVVLEGRAVARLMPHLMPLLDGTRTLDDIDRALGEAVAPAVRHALTVLADRGLLLDGPSLGAELAASVADTVHFFAAASHAPSLASCEEMLGRAQVVVVGTGPCARDIAAQLGGAGVAKVEVVDWAAVVPPDAVDLAIAAPEPEELSEITTWNRQALDTGTPWLQVLPYDGRIAAVGPLYVPGETGCYECFGLRRSANVSYPSADYRALQDVPAAYPCPPPLRMMVVGLGAMLALQWLSDRAVGPGQSAVPATMHALAWSGTLQHSTHRLHRVPRCPVCFPDDQGTPSPWHD